MKRLLFTTVLFALLLMSGGVARGQMVQQLANIPDAYISCCSHPEANILYVGGLQGVYKSTDNGETWTMVHEYDTTVHIPQSLDDTIYSIPFFYMNFMDETIGFASKTRNPKSYYLFDLESISGHPAHNDSPGLFKTSDGGVTWEMVDSSHYFINIQFAGPGTVYAYEKQEKTLYKSVNGGMIWARVFNEDIDISDYSLVDGNIVYAIKGAGYIDGEPPVLPTVYKSSDGGESWVLILNNEMNPSKAPVHLDIIHFYEDGKGVLMGHRQIFTEDDFTTYNWQESGFTGVFYASRNVQSCYLGSGSVLSTCASMNGVQDVIKMRVSRDFGRHSSCQSLCDSYLGVAAITGCEEDTVFFVAVDDRLYRIDGSGFPSVGVEEYENRPGVTIAPNPVTENCQIRSESPIKEVWLYDMLGKMLGYYEYAGTVGEVMIPTSSWGSGTYFLKINTERGLITKKVIKK